MPDLDLLFSKASVSSFDNGTILCEAYSEVETVYFPLDGLLSLAIVMNAGKAVETASVGREGVFGAMAGLDLHTSDVRAIVLVKTRALHIPAAGWRSLVAKRQRFRDLSVKYNEVLLTQARISGACNALHLLDARLCRWLLQADERAPLSEQSLTQQSLSGALGVRRTSITEAAIKLREAGIIEYSRGHIKIIDRARLEQLSCECYETLKQRRALA